MKRSTRSALIKNLKRDGFKLATGFAYLYINSEGKIYNLKKGRYMKPTKQNQIKPEDKYLSVPKLILQAFAGQPYRSGQIQYIDGNKNNLTPENLKYSRLFTPDQKPEAINPDHLLTAIRCYFQVRKKFKVNETPQTKRYLKQITDFRGFFILNRDKQYIQVFNTYLNGNNKTKYSYILNKSSIAETAKEYGLTVRDCSIIVNQFINLLITEVLTDFENGRLSIQDYKPKPPTKTDTIREYNKDLVKRGKKPLPLRKKSAKEQLRDFEKHVNEIKKLSEK